MDKLITELLISIIESADNAINYAFDNLIDLCFNAEDYLTQILGLEVINFDSLNSIILSFAISLIVLKFLKKGVEMYISWTDGSADTPIHIYILYFVRSIIVILVFPLLYDIFVSVGKDFSNDIMQALNITNQEALTQNLATISGVGIFTALLGVIDLIMLILLYVQALMRGVEMFVLKISFPIFCTGLLDSNKGIFAPYIKKFFQSVFTIILQIALAKIVVLLISTGQLIMSVATLLVALRTPKFLQEFVLLSGNGSSGISNIIHTTSKIIELKGQISKK